MSLNINYYFPVAAGTDYTAVLARLITFDPGQPNFQFQTIPVNTLADDSAEEDEQFTATLSSPSSGATIGTASVAMVTITDNSAVIVELSPPTLTVMEGVGSLEFTIFRRTPTTRTVSVVFNTADGTAVDGEGRVNMTGVGRVNVSCVQRASEGRVNYDC